MLGLIGSVGLGIGLATSLRLELRVRVSVSTIVSINGSDDEPGLPSL